jgi:hypothetical protein
MLQNNLDGELPSTLSNLHNLTLMYVRMRLSSSGSGYHHRFPTIVCVRGVCSDLSINNITGSIPRSISKLTNLDTLYVGCDLQQQVAFNN